MITASALILLLPRRYVIIPLLTCILLTPPGQNICIGGVHLFVARILILLGWTRVLCSPFPSGKPFPWGPTLLDKVFIVWALTRAISVILLFGAVGALINQVAFLLDALGGYFLFRSLIRDRQDVETAIKTLAVVAVVCAIGMVREHLTGQNLFGLLGGMRATPDTRNGKLRAQASFAISIAAGTFGATTFPLFLWLWSRTKARLLTFMAGVSSVVMVFASSSSTPVMAWVGSLLAVVFWPVRRNMRTVRWAIVALIAALALVMKAPVWFLLARVDVVGGSTGYDRAMLIDNFVRHFWDWWLIGTHDYVNWGWDMWDQCNQFVTEGETGGLVGFICFVSLIVICFKLIGRARKMASGKTQEWLCWLLGVTMFAQVLAFMGIDYFDQSKFVWYTMLVIIPIGVAGLESKKSIEGKPAPVALENLAAFPRLANDLTSATGSRHLMLE